MIEYVLQYLNSFYHNNDQNLCFTAGVPNNVTNAEVVEELQV